MKADIREPEQAKRTKSENGEALVPAFLTDSVSQTLDQWAKSNLSLTKSALDIAREMVAFSQARLQANVDAWMGLAACRNPDDLIKFQGTFAQSAATDYLNEANKLTAHLIRALSMGHLPEERPKS